MVMVVGGGSITGLSNLTSSLTSTVQLDSPSYLKFNSTAGGQSSEYWIGRGGIGGNSLAFYSQTGNALEFGIANDCKFFVDTNGQMYHNASGAHLFSSSKNHYYAKTTTPINVVSSGWTDTYLVWSGVYLPTNFRKVYLNFHLTMRNNGVGQNHTGFRAKVYDTGTGATTYVGDGSWGFGISMDIGNNSYFHHCTYDQEVNLYDYDVNGNQGNLTAGHTYNITLQAYDAYGSGSNLRLAAEADGAHVAYTPCYGTVWVL